MKRNSFLWGTLTSILIAMSYTLVVACDDGGNGGNGNNGSNNGKGNANKYVIGTWSGLDVVTYYSYTFESDGTGIMIVTGENGSYSKTYPFTYVADNDSEGIIIIKYYDSSSGTKNSTEIEYYSIKGSTMIVGSEYGDDYDVLRLTKNREDSTGSNNNTSTNSLIGIWKDVSGYDSSPNYVTTFTFKQDGKGVYLATDIGYRRESAFTYTTESSSKGKIFLDNGYGGTDYIYYVIRNGKMYISFGDYNKDPEWILSKQ